MDTNEPSYRDGKNLVDDIDGFDNKVVKCIYEAFISILQLRNKPELPRTYDEQEQRNGDYIFSPAIVDGEQFDSRKDYDNKVTPKDADANGAYHIALKGLLYLKKLSAKKKAQKELSMTVAEWLKFVQNKEYMDK